MFEVAAPEIEGPHAFTWFSKNGGFWGFILTVDDGERYPKIGGWNIASLGGEYTRKNLGAEV